MVRRSARILAPLALIALGCQDYNFNPVGHCLIQPGTKRYTLSSMSTADILFVVDDSGSMGGEQQNLARNFDAFVTELSAMNQARVASGLGPIDFHIAITTTSVFLASPVPNATCRQDCNGYAGQNFCCGTFTKDTSAVVRRCGGGGTCGVGYSCRTDCPGHTNEHVCCDTQQRLEPVSCTTVNDPCPDIIDFYNSAGSAAFPTGVIPCLSTSDCPPNDTCEHCSTSTTGNICCTGGVPRIGQNCIAGVAPAGGAPYPAGDFVSATVNGKRNPTVQHFDKSLYEPVINQTAIDALVAQFKQNVQVGTCGSGQEQGLQAGRLAVQKALAGLQTDYDASGNPTKAAWPHSNSKLLVAFVGDEDDCSSPNDPTKVLLLQTVSGNVGGISYDDTCQYDSLQTPDLQKEYAISDFSGYLASLGRPLGAGFIVSATGATSSTCVDQACSAGICCDTACSALQGWGSNVCSTNICGGQGPGRRFLDMAQAIRDLQSDVVAGSVCDPDFSSILQRLAQIVEPKWTLILPSMPAAGEVTMLRIVDSNGNTRVPPGWCDGPALPPTDVKTADQRFDWWFIGTGAPKTDLDRTPTVPSQYIWINHIRGIPCTSDSQCNGTGGFTCRQTGCKAPFDTGGSFCCNAAGDAQAMQHCEANPGETYSADYLGMVPADGCLTVDNCVTALGGTTSDWTCEISTGMTRGTCLCASAR